MTITIDTVGKCLSHGYKVHAHCGCGHHGPIDLAAISVARGESYPLEKVWAKARCSRCRSRRVSLQLTPDWNPYPGAPIRP